MFGLRHDFFGIFAADAAHDFRLVGLSGDDGDFPRFTLDERAIAINEGNSACFFHPAVASGAVFEENGADVAIKADLVGHQIEAE